MIGTMAGMIMRRHSPAVPRDAAQASRATPAPRSAREAFFDLVEQVARQERIAEHVAMLKVRADRPLEYQAAFPPRAASPRRRFRPQPAAPRQPELVAAWH